MRRIGFTGTVCLIVVAALALPGAASPSQSASRDNEITITGKGGPNHVFLGVRGDHLTVSGSPTHKQGCCSLSGVSRVVVELGGGGDKLDVTDALPVPLTVKLGGGNDKAILNGEDDTCLQQGGARNRCLGGGGDDICIGGPGRGDCLGGPGNDSCDAMADNDGCFGGPGNDVCDMGPGSDECFGDSGDDTLDGGSGNDRLDGGPDKDSCDGGPGTDGDFSCESAVHTEAHHP